jgi:hypothetical protein
VYENPRNPQTDGKGGFAMGTVAGLRTRRYHGVLVTATAPPIGRRMALAALEPVLVIGDCRFPLGTHEWENGAISPAGYELLDQFDLDDGVPRWRWSVGPVSLEADLAMAHGRSAVGVRYRLLSAGASPVSVGVGALCTWRDVRGERRGEGRPDVQVSGEGFVFEQAYTVRGPGFEPGGDWYRGVCCREEAARGLDAVEDVWYAGRFSAVLEPGGTVEIEAWAEDLDIPPPPASQIISAARARAADLAARAGGGHGRRCSLVPSRRPVHRRRCQQHDRCRWLPVVRRLVARHHDVVRGPVPRDGTRGRGPRPVTGRRRFAL